MTKAIVIRPDRTTERVEFDGWEDIVSHLDCRLFTVIPNLTDEPFELYGDDEGALVAPEFLFKNEFGTIYYDGNPIFGNVMAVGPLDSEGNSTDLPEHWMSIIEEIMAMDADDLGDLTELASRLTETAKQIMIGLNND